jgi:DNA-binding response OmpR family regulator
MTSEAAATVLIVEDERAMVTGLKFNLEARGYQVLAAYDGEEGYQKAIKEKPDLIILDLMLPKYDGYEVCRRLKKEVPDIPILMLTARSQEAEVVLGLELGADDYVTKPFSLLELMARVQAILRRAKPNDRAAETFCFGDVEINFKKYVASKKGKPLELSPREYEILRYFKEHRDEAVSRNILLDAIWGYSCFSTTRTVDTHIAKLRQKIEEDPHAPRHIITIPGVGYKFVD